VGRNWIFNSRNDRIKRIGIQYSMVYCQISRTLTEYWIVGMIGLGGLESNIQWCTVGLAGHLPNIYSGYGRISRTRTLNLCLDRFSQGILNLVTKILNCACSTYYHQNCNCGTRSRSGDLHRFGWFNLCLDRFSQGILNLVTKILDCACGTYYNQNHSCGTRRADQVTFTDLDGSTCV